MKELSIEEKQKTYDEAIRKLRGMMPNWERLSYNGKTFLQDLIYIFPELKESEDERIRKEIISFLQLPHPQFVGERKQEKWIAWLEKQGEKKSVNLNELTWEDINDLDAIMNEVRSDFRNGIGEKSFGLEVLERFLYNKEYEHLDIKSPKFKEGDEIHSIDGQYEDTVLEVLSDGSYRLKNLGLLSIPENEWELVNAPVNGYELIDKKEQESFLIEKQGKQKEYTFKSIPRLLDMIEPNDRAKAYCQKLIDTLAKEGYNTDVKIVEEVLKGWNGEDVPMAVMDEQKPINKVQPKFKVGDWIVTDKNHIWLIDEDCSTTGYSYRLISQNGKVEVGDYNIVDEHARLWTIQDAKDGDVLSYRDGQWIFIYKKQVDDNSFHYYSLYSTIHQDLTIDDSAFTLLGDAIIPATKEQQDLLFQKMKEAGYEWDAKNKELNKIHIIDEGKSEMDYCFTKMMNGEKVTPVWSEEDEKNISTIRIALRDAKLDAPEEFESYGRETTVKDFENAESWLKSIKPQLKHEFGEEDEKMVGNIRSIIEKYAISQSAVDVNGDLCEKIYIDADNWLKSLKQRLIG